MKNLVQELSFATPFFSIKFSCESRKKIASQAGRNRDRYIIFQRKFIPKNDFAIFAIENNWGIWLSVAVGDREIGQRRNLLRLFLQTSHYSYVHRRLVILVGLLYLHHDAMISYQYYSTTLDLYQFMCGHLNSDTILYDVNTLMCIYIRKNLFFLKARFIAVRKW